MNIFKRINLIVVAFASLFVLAVGVPAIAFAQTPKQEVCKGVNSTATGTCADDNIASIAKTIIDILSWIVGVVAVIMMVIAGLTMVTSAGEAEKAKKAKSTITYALVGLVIVLLAQVIIRFVIKQVG
jgi:uncharacterized membrane protein